MKTTFSEILENKIPSFAKESRLPSFFSISKNKIFQEFRDIVANTRNAGQSREVAGRLAEIIQSKEFFFKTPPSQLPRNLSSLYPLKGLQNNKIHDWVWELRTQNWLKDDRHLALRILIFLMVYNSNSYANYPERLLTEFPEEYQLELFALSILAYLSNGNYNQLFEFLSTIPTKHLQIQQAIDQDSKWFYDLLETNTEINFDGNLEDSIQRYNHMVNELVQRAEKIERKDFYRITIQELSTLSEILELPNDRLYYFYKTLNIINSNNHGIQRKPYFSKTNEICKYLLPKISWNTALIADFVHSQRKTVNYDPLPRELLEAVKKQYADKTITTELARKLWDYCLFYKTSNRSFPPIWKFVRQGSAPKEINPNEILSWGTILRSGFNPVPIPHNHSPYFGLHPDQVRPMFRLLQSVTPIDLIKFYKVEKQYYVRFLFQEEIYNLSTGDGFGTGCMRDLNTLLFEKGVPYQFLVLDMGFNEDIFSKKSTSVNYLPTVFTLVNEQYYKHYGQKIRSQLVAGFASVDYEVPPFTANLEDLKQIRSRTDLDKIELKGNSKFLAIQGELDKLTPSDKWAKVLLHAMTFPLNTKPGKLWQKKTETLVSELPVENFQSGMTLIMDAILKGEEWFLDDEKLAGLRGLTWMCRLNTNSNLLFLLQKVANKAYRKVTGGALNAKLGNIALETLSKIGTTEAYGAMGNLAAKSKYSVYQGAIKKYLKNFKELLKKYSAEELEDRVILSHGLSNGKKEIKVDDYKALLELEGLKINIRWSNPNGKITKSVPASLRKDFAGDVKAVKAEAKSIEGTLLAQGARLEKRWLTKNSWAFSDWKQFYLDHGLMNFLIKKLIWIATDGNESTSFMVDVDGFYLANQNRFTISEDMNIRLWHPALASVNEVLEWRNFLFDKRIKQPFKQAFREVYLLTEAEESTFDHSNRFSGHRLKGNTLYGLGKNREWTMSYDQAPIRFLPKVEIAAVLSISGGVLYSSCTTESLSFCRWESSKKSNLNHRNKIPLAEVPPVILSEIMRDVDLFVAVSSISIDPYFDQNNSGEALGYWRNFSFGEKSKGAIADVRKDLLNRLLPMTKIADQVTLEGNYLHVKGSIKNYKINLGSGNILMEPNDQYLCIVPAPDKKMEKKIWLPFEGGDRTLMVILSKAFLLADDDKITDGSILSQIRRS